MRKSTGTNPMRRHNSAIVTRSLDRHIGMGSTFSQRNPIRDKHLPKPIVLTNPKSKSTFSPNSENVGGRILIDQSFRRHREQLQRAKKQVDNSLPWSYRQRELEMQRAYKKKKQQVSPKKRPLDKTKKKKKKDKTSMQDIKESLDLTVLKSDPTLLLDEDERLVYTSFVEMLSKFCDRKAEKHAATYLSDLLQKIGKTAANDAIERYLLSNYGHCYSMKSEEWNAESMHRNGTGDWAMKTSNIKRDANLHSHDAHEIGQELEEEEEQDQTTQSEDNPDTTVKELSEEDKEMLRRLLEENSSNDNSFDSYDREYTKEDQDEGDDELLSYEDDLVGF